LQAAENKGVELTGGCGNVGEPGDGRGRLKVEKGVWAGAAVGETFEVEVGKICDERIYSAGFPALSS